MTVAVHMMVSALEARAAVSVSDEPVPSEEPVVILVHAKLSVRLSLSSSLALTEQVRVAVIARCGRADTDTADGWCSVRDGYAA